MYETVSYSGWFGVALTLAAQPVVVSLAASYGPFANYVAPTPRNVFSDPKCYDPTTTVLDHSVTIVGYQLVFTTPYWIIRNNWGDKWGSNGYMKLAMFSSSPYGICGIYVDEAVYPIVSVPGNPCNAKTGLTSPCGQGQCKPRPDWGPYSYSCDCSALAPHFVTANNTVNVTKVLLDGKKGITQSCVPAKVCDLALVNPCGAGLCVDDNKGQYSCVCPFGWENKKQIDGTEFCERASVTSGGIQTIRVTQPQITCRKLAIAFGLTVAQLQNQTKPRPNCGTKGTAELPINTTVDVSNPNYPGCLTTYATNEGDTISNIAAQYTSPVNATVDSFRREIMLLNPELGTDPAAAIEPGLPICLQRQTSPDPPDLECGQFVPVVPGTARACDRLILMYFSGGTVSADDGTGVRVQSSLDFFTLNPGISCDVLSNPRIGLAAGSLPPVHVCVQLSTGQGCSSGSKPFRVRQSCGQGCTWADLLTCPNPLQEVRKANPRRIIGDPIGGQAVCRPKFCFVRTV